MVTGTPMDEKCISFFTHRRNVLVESCRLARGPVKNLKDIDLSAYDMLVVPGGYGVAKNLCDFAVKGADYTVEPLVAKLLKDCYERKMHMAFCCIAPILAAKTLGTKVGGPGVNYTLGQSEGPSWPNAGAISTFVHG